MNRIFKIVLGLIGALILLGLLAAVLLPLLFDEQDLAENLPKAIAAELVETIATLGLQLADSR